MRTSPIHYIAPSAISIIPNANGTVSDLAVYVARGAKIKVYSPRMGIDMVNSTYQEWTIAGRNRRLIDDTAPYTIYARLRKSDKTKGYIVFARKQEAGDTWVDKYPYVENYERVLDEVFYVRLGDVTKPEDGQRTVKLDTGILGTDQYNESWALNPDDVPLRVDVSSSVGDKEMGAMPYVYWGDTVKLVARLIRGWDVQPSTAVDRWTIRRDTGKADADAAWNYPESTGDGTDEPKEREMTDGVITLVHSHDNDDFEGIEATAFTLTAWGKDADGNDSVIAMTTIVVHAETDAQQIVDTLGNELKNLAAGNENLLRNGGFSGEYITQDEDRTLAEVDYFAHWQVTGAELIDTDESVTGKAVRLDNGSLVQELETPLVAGNHYIFSFRGFGSQLTFSVGGYSQTITLTAKNERYNIKFTAPEEGPVFSVTEATGTLMELQLVKGTIPNTDWINSHKDDYVAKGAYTFDKGLRSNTMSIFEKGAQFGTFVRGQLAGTGAQIDKDGRIEAQSLTLREYLEVPELRFNRAEIIAGNTTQTPCGGIIDTVTIITQGDATTPGTGAATLKLEDDEIGKIKVGDFCMGYWHDMNGGNATYDSDDRQGRMAFSGFKTVYFRITEIPDNDPEGKSNWDKHYFIYTLRPQGSDVKWEGGNGIHPFPMMHFAGRGNSSDPERQGFTIHTPSYTARLSGVSTWEFSTANYTYVNGNLDGFGNLIGRPNLTGFGTIDMNLYMKGHIIQVENTPDYISVQQSLMGLLGKKDVQTVTITVMDGYRQDHTQAYRYAVMRDSGNVADDERWNNKHTDVSSSWQMSYDDLRAERCTFTIIATSQSDGKVLTESFIARRNIAAYRYYLTVNTDIVRVDMEGNLTGNASSMRLVGNDGHMMKENGLYLATNKGYGNGSIVAQAWRSTGSENVAKADATDGLLIRVTSFSGMSSEQEDESVNGNVSFTVDKSCDKYIVELIDADDESIIYDTKTIAIVRDGSASIVADFDDEMGACAAASDGTVLRGLPYSSTAHLYKGSAKLQLTDAKIVSVNGTDLVTPVADYDDNGIVASIAFSGTDAMLTLTSLAQTAPDNCRFGIRLTGEGESAIAYFYMNKFKAGSDGHVTLYQLQTDVTAIKINKQSQRSATIVNVSVLKIDTDENGQTEENISITDSGLSCRYALDADITASSGTTTGEIPCANVEQKISLQLVQSVAESQQPIVWDQETIPVIRDGLDSSYQMKFANEKIEDTTDDRWHADFRAGDNWAIMSSDGQTWHGPYPIIGEEGKPGDYTEFSFGISSQDITNGAKFCPEDLKEANSWSDGVVAVTEQKPYLWMRTGKFVWNESAGTHTLDSNGYTYARVKGIDAPDRYELEQSDTSFIINQDGETFTPEEVLISAVRVKANGSRDVLEQQDYNNGSVQVSVAYVNSDNTTGTIASPELSFSGTAVRVKQTLTNAAIGITTLRSVTLTFTFSAGSGSVAATPATATVTIPVMRDGRDGAIAVIADFDDEMVSVPTDSTGKAQVSADWNWQTAAHLYRGTEQLVLNPNECKIVSTTNHLWTNTYLSFSDDGKTAILQVNGFDDMQEGSSVQPNTDNCKAIIRLTSVDGYTATATAYVNKIPAGEGGDGKDAVIYSLSIDTNVVKYVNGVYTPGGIKVKIRETKGETVTEYNYDAFLPGKIGVSPSRNKWIYYKYDSKVTDYNDSSASSMESENIDAGGEHYIHITLWAGTGILLDSETIPIVRDGETPEVEIINGQWYVNGNATGVSALGSDGASVALQFSVDGESGWHNSFTNGDLYAREVKIDGNGTKYGQAFRIVGEKGDPGNPGNYTDYKFGRSAQATIADSQTAPEIDGGWIDGMPVPSSAYPYIWMRKALMMYNSEQQKYVEGTPYYTRVTGADGKDGKDAAAYEFIRFSDDAKLVNGVWTGSFTPKSQEAIDAEASAQGDSCNLAPNTDFEEWDSENNVPVGWVQYDGPGTFMRQRDADGVVWINFSAIGGENAKGFRIARDCDKDKGPLYLIPNTYGQTYNVSVRYKGNGRAMIVVHYWKWTEGETTVSWLRTYAEYIYAEGYDDNTEHTITDTFTSQDNEATHFDIQLVHHYGQGDEKKTYNFAFAQPKVEIGSAATPYTVAPAWNPCLDGTTQGLWKGTLRWDKPYASTRFADYEWSKVRDAEPRMNTWSDIASSLSAGGSSAAATTGDEAFFYCGAYGEPFYDIMYDGANFWLCKQTYRRDLQIEVTVDGEKVKKYITPDEPSLWSLYWEMASQFNFLMAKTFYAINAFIERLVVRKLQTVSEAGSCVEIQNGIINLWADLSSGSTNQSRFEFGTTAEGKAVLRYYDEDGTQLYDLGPNGITQELSSRNNVWTTKRLSSIRTDYNDGRPYPTGYVVHIRTNSSTVSDYHELTSEGYAMLSNNVKSYYFSGGTAPSDYEGRTFLREFTKTEANPGYIPDGWYRAENTSGETFGNEQILDDGHGTTMTATVYTFQTWYYTNGKVTHQKLVQLELLSDGTGMVTN